MAAGTPCEAAGPADRALVYLVRHGQTPLNESGVLRGLLDPLLDEAGHQQARRLAAALGPRMPRAVVASPLLRVTQTAQPIADREKVIAQRGSVDNAPGVEPPGAVRDRAVRGLTDIGQRSRGGTVVVISHDAVNRQVLVAFDPGLGDPDTLSQDNGCFNTLELRSGSWTVLSVNELPVPP